MKRLLILSSILFFLLCSAGLAGATLITFDSLTPGSSMSSYSEAGVTFSTSTTFIPQPPLLVFSDQGKTGIIGNVSVPWVPIKADFDYYASSVSVVLGDFNPDTEEVHLEAYDDADNLIAQTISTLSNNGERVWHEITVSVAASNIDYVIWSSFNLLTLPDDSILADSFEFTPVPEPATMLLLSSGLIGLAGLRRKFRKR